MFRSAILRFSDAEKSTVLEHAELIRTKSSAWWGWWKKRTEAFPVEALQYLKSEALHHALAVGLVKRKEEEGLYLASCTDVAFEHTGAPIGSPDPELTPEYYRGAKFPAWFKFTNIGAIDRSMFLSQFGCVPRLDPTFYDVSRGNDGKFTINPAPTWSMQIVNAPGDAILHLSDLHFGDDYGPQSPPATDYQRLVEKISSRILRELRVRVGVLIVSGDLITRGQYSAFPRVRTFLESLLRSLGLGVEHCVVVPGNHDLWTEGIDHPSRDYSHEGPYREFLDTVFRAHLQDLERVRRYETPGGFELIFVELNSARLRSDDLREYGYVSKHRYSGLLRFTSDVLKQETSSPTARLINQFISKQTSGSRISSFIQLKERANDFRLALQTVKPALGPASQILP